MERCAGRGVNRGVCGGVQRGLPLVVPSNHRFSG